MRDAGTIKSATETLSAALSKIGEAIAASADPKGSKDNSSSPDGTKSEQAPEPAPGEGPQAEEKGPQDGSENATDVPPV